MKSKMHLISPLIILLSINSFATLAQPVVVSGVIPGGEHREIRLMSVADQISFKPAILDRTIVSSLGQFTLTADIMETLVTTLDIGFYSAAIALIPGKQYEIVCDSISFANEFRPFYQKESLYFEIIEEPDPRLNHRLSAFEHKYFNFITDHFELYSGRIARDILTRFRKEMNDEFGMISDEFFRVYVDYKIATIELSVASSVKAHLFGLYLNDKPVHYNNPEYMFFFNTFFDQYLPGNNRFISRRDLIATVNHQADYKALMDTLGKDTLLRNEVIRELVLLKTLKELYHNRSFSGRNILSILGQVESLSKFSKHREIAGNLIHELTLLEVGFPAPDFKLPALEGDTVALSDLVGKPVYIFFMTTLSHGCLVEFEQLENLHLTYGKDIHFVTVSFDETPEITDKFRNLYDFQWLFLYNGPGFDLINDYRIKTYPTFALIRSDGTIAEYPAYKPSEVIEQSFQSLLK
jgi:peroxiredoxin